MTDVLVIVAHPDDAELAIGGVISSFSALGNKVTIANFTVSENNEANRERRIVAATKAANILGADLTWAFDKKYDQVADIPEYLCVKEVDKLVEAHSPKIVMSHTNLDSHADHVRLSNAVIASSRRWKADLYAFQPNEYRAPTYRSFQPNVFIDTTEYLEQKLSAVECYNYGSSNFQSLIQDNIRRIDSFNGLACNCKYAEGLILIRKQGLTI